MQRLLAAMMVGILLGTCCLIAYADSNYYQTLINLLSSADRQTQNRTSPARKL